MLSRPSKTVAKRFASTATASRVIQEKTSVLNNGLSVSSVELNGANSSLVLAFRAGSRYQPANKQGLVHIIRNSIGRDSHEFPGLSLVWNTAANGGQIRALSNRDILAVKLDVVRDNVPVALSLLGQLGTNAFKPWDVEDVKHDTIQPDHVYLTGNTIALEQLHQAAFRNGPLARSNYGTNNVSASDITTFASQRLLSGEAVLVGVNVNHDLLVESAAQQFPIAEGTATQSPESKYFGGEARKDGPGSQTFVAIAGEGASLKSHKDAAVQAVVAQILLDAAQKVCLKSESVNLNYQDAGLVGVQFYGDNSGITSKTKSIVSALKTAEISNINAAKNTAALKVLTSGQKASNVALDVATQVLSGINALSPSEFAETIKSVSEQDVSKFLSRVTGKLSLAAYGTPSLVPFLDEL
ncbi:unnamed protein product [Caenorhabditis bovis]|uniref:Peptidase M16 N-terminal domain-containing protein n=1 Tax=Caenorhabditis bovis TaxID=2654633 RepID=A0A8S1EKE4_9PELO|nr:unnamed protein product [Caenorhabditis bovis]